MSARVREWLDEHSSSTAATATGAAAQHQTPPDAETAAAPMTKRARKVSPVLRAPEDESENEDDGEVDETFLALQKLLMNMEGMRRSQVAPVSAQVVQANSSNSSTATTAAALAPGTRATATTAASREEMLESRRREREQFRHMLLSKSAASGSRRRRPTYYCFDDDDDDDETPAPSVESTISNRMMNGSFSRYSVHVISRDRWAREDPERLPIVLLPKNGQVSSPADNPKLNIMHTAEYIDLSEQLDAKLRNELKDDVCHLTPPRSTWCIQMRDFDALQCE